MLHNRQWILRSRPLGAVALEHFSYREVDLAEPDLQVGEVLVRNLIYSCAPTMRNWMNDSSRSYRASVGIGEPIIGPVGSQVIRSRNSRFPEGCLLTGVSRWQDYDVLQPDTSPTPVLPLTEDVTLVEAMGVYGLNSLTAYFGLLKVGQPKPGETVVVSAAAGSVGSVALQIATILGCRAIGIAGGSAKCELLRNTLGASAAIDYKSEDVSRRLAELCPEGVDVFFDNVGGDIAHAVMQNIAVHGRIAVCGQVSAYDSGQPAPGPRDMMQVVYRRVRIQGFVLGDFAQEAQVARRDLKRWTSERKLLHRVDLRRGFENLPRAFLDLFSGQHDGTLLVQVADVEPMDAVGKAG
jgi:NADPH-dependent curcumin reductase CurA